VLRENHAESQAIDDRRERVALLDEGNDSMMDVGQRL